MIPKEFSLPSPTKRSTWTLSRPRSNAYRPVSPYLSLDINRFLGSADPQPNSTCGLRSADAERLAFLPKVHLDFVRVLLLVLFMLMLVEELNGEEGRDLDWLDDGPGILNWCKSKFLIWNSIDHKLALILKFGPCRSKLWHLITIWPITNKYVALFLNYYFRGRSIKSIKRQLYKSKDCSIIDKNTIGSKLKKLNASRQWLA